MGKSTDTFRRAAPSRINPDNHIDMKNNGKYKTISINNDNINNDTNVEQTIVFSTSSRKRTADVAGLETTVTITADQYNNTVKNTNTGDITMIADNIELPNKPLSLSRPSKMHKSSHGIPSRTPVTGAIWRESTLYAAKKQSSQIKNKALKTSNWAKVMNEKAALQSMRARSAEIRADINAKRTAERERIKAAKQRKAENEKKSQVVVPITDTKKLKKLNRKQLRQIQKR